MDNYKRATKYQQEAILLSKKLNFPSRISFTTAFLGWACLLAGQFEKAQSLAKDGERIGDESHSLNGVASSYLVYSILACIDKNPDLAQQNANLAVGIFDKTNPNLLPLAYSTLAVALCSAGHFQQAMEQVKINSPLLISAMIVPSVGMDCAVRALAFTDDGLFERAALGLGFILGADYTTFGWAKKWSLLQETREKLQSELDGATFNAAWETGRQMSLEEAVAYIRAGLE